MRPAFFPTHSWLSQFPPTALFLTPSKLTVLLIFLFSHFSKCSSKTTAVIRREREKKKDGVCSAPGLYSHMLSGAFFLILWCMSLCGFLLLGVCAIVSGADSLHPPSPIFVQALIYTTIIPTLAECRLLHKTFIVSSPFSLASLFSVFASLTFLERPA